MSHVGDDVPQPVVEFRFSHPNVRRIQWKNVFLAGSSNPIFQQELLSLKTSNINHSKIFNPGDIHADNGTVVSSEPVVVATSYSQDNILGRNQFYHQWLQETV